MNQAVIPLIVLIITVTIGFIKKINIGFFAVGAAYLLGLYYGLSAKQITAGFSGSMMVTLTGVTFLFGMASQNGTLEKFSRRIIAMTGKHTWAIPLLIFCLSAFISAIGPGHIAAGILMTTFAVFIAAELHMNPIGAALIAKLGANAGAASPLAMAGIIAKNLAAEAGYTGIELHIFLSVLLAGFLFAIIVYFIYRLYKFRPDHLNLKHSDEHFTTQQLITLAVMTITVVCCIGFHLDTGLFSFAAGSALVLFGCADEKKAIRSIPWSTLFLICGVGVLVNVIEILGGIDLIADFLHSFMTTKTAAPIIAATSGTLSWVSTTTGVVMPTMFPVAHEICLQFGGSVSFAELAATITASSFAAAISPLTTGGAIIMTSYSSVKETTTEEMNVLFHRLFLLSALNLLFHIVLAACGVFHPGTLLP